MRIAIIQFPGSNCERETAMAVRRAGMQPEDFLWNMPAEKLADYAGFVIVGGFSYEDRSRAGVIAALDPIMQTLHAESAKGKPILGICNGAQILVESGLVPGTDYRQLSLALTDNRRVQNGQVVGTGYYNAEVYMRVSDRYQLNAFTRHLTPENILRIPVAHAEGRFVIPPVLLHEMQLQGMNVFQYCDAAGNIAAEFPINPNGSIDNIAAMSNRAGNVMAMMPHPERTAEGDAIFKSMRDYIANHVFQPVKPLSYQPRSAARKPYPLPHIENEFIVQLWLTDNHTASVENALQARGFPVKIKRFVHWKMNDIAEADKIHASGVLYNDRKERLVARDQLPNTALRLLVQAQEDIVGAQKQQILQHHFGVAATTRIQHGVLWCIDAPAEYHAALLDTHIFFNPFSHEVYHYVS